MNRFTESNRRLAFVVVLLAVIGAACGSNAEAAEEVAPESGSTSSSISSTATSPVADTSTTATAPIDDGASIAFNSATGTLAPGSTVGTDTDVPFRFTVPESEGTWLSLIEEKWFVTMLYTSASLAGAGGQEPGLNLAVAEEGATLESVAETMVASRPEIPYERSDGMFGGREVIVLEGTYDNQGDGSPVQIYTGDESFLMTLFAFERTYRSHIFEENGRVFVVSVDADVDDVTLVLAEAAPLFESLETGAGG